MPIVIAVAILLCAWPALAGDRSVAAQTSVGDRTVAENVMTEDRFWALIARTTVHEADPEHQLDALRQVLGDLTPAEIEAFQRAFRREQAR